MGSLFLSIPIPKKEGLYSYKISLRVLASAYFAIGLLTIAILVFNLADNSREYFTFINIFIASSQALLFTFSIITLINPTFANRKNILYHTLPYILFVTLYTLSFSIYGDPVLITAKHALLHIGNPTIWIRLLFLLYFLFQLIYYTQLFLKETKKYNTELMNYFSDVVQLKLKWVYIAFFAALTVGVTALISCFLPKSVDWLITGIFALFYFGFALEYIKYNRVYAIIEPAISEAIIEVEQANNPLRIKSDWLSFKEEIIRNRYYCETGITIEELASKLKIGRTTLSNLINREEGVNFNAWINRLRIEDAKQLLLDNPECSLSIIAEQVGFSEQSNFSRQFKLVTGESPMVWRKGAMAS